MRYRKLDANGDYSINAFHQDTPAGVGQAILTRLKLFTAEYWLDTSEGTPWRTQVLGKYTASSYDSVLKARILDTDGVLSIDSYTSSLDHNTRKLSVAATVTTIYGALDIEETL